MTQNTRSELFFFLIFFFLEDWENKFMFHKVGILLHIYREEMLKEECEKGLKPSKEMF